MKMSKRIEVMADTDELGELEEFTFDLFPVVDPAATVHLGTNGLPPIGTRILPGMVVVGKIGKTRSYDPSQQPTELETHGLPFDELRSRYGHMWRDSSLYADSKTTGVVKQASIEVVKGRQVAVIVIED
jgi:DNA-directed RNA polymerase beta subunit